MVQKPKKIRYVSELSFPEQKWLARAIVTIFLADDTIEDSQIAYMKKLSKVFWNEEPKETIKEIARYLREREVPEIDPLVVEDPEHLIFMLNTLVSSIFTNEDKQDEEVRRYFKAGLKLGVTHQVLMLKLTYQKERFRIKMAQKEVDEEIRRIVRERAEKSIREGH